MKACKAVAGPRWPKRNGGHCCVRTTVLAGHRMLSVCGVLNTNRQADVFLPGPGSANTILIDPWVGIGAGAPACLRRQACSCPSQSDVLSHAWCQACVESCLLGRVGQC